MDIIVFGIKYDTIKAALEAYGLTPARYERWKNYYDTPGEAIEAMLRKDKERKEEKDRIRAINEAGITEYMYDKYKDQADTIEEVIALAKTGIKEREEEIEISRYCEKKGVSYARFKQGKEDPAFEGMSPKEIIDILSNTKTAKSKEAVEINGEVFPTVRSALRAYGFTDSQYNYIRQNCDTPQEAVNILIKRGSDNNKRGRRKSIVVNGRSYETVRDFCDYMDISVKSLYDRKRRYGYDDIEKCANDYYKLVKDAGGSREKKVFHKLSVKIDGVVYHGLDDFLKKRNITKKDFEIISKLYYPKLAPDKWYMIAKRYDVLKEKYEKDKRKVVRGKKYSSLNAVCEEYGVSRPQIYWYRDTYRPGADAWDIIEEYLDYKGIK